jgi:hypothetical protein
VTLPGFPDAEGAVIGLLAGLVADGSIGSETPEDLESAAPFIRVTRTGGGDDMVTDTATVSVDVFAASGDDARSVAEQARATLTLPVSMGGVPKGSIDRAVTVTGPASLPPTDSDNLRLVVASYRVSMRREP